MGCERDIRPSLSRITHERRHGISMRRWDVSVLDLVDGIESFVQGIYLILIVVKRSMFARWWNKRLLKVCIVVEVEGRINR